MRLQWIGQTATARSSDVANLECLNMYAEVVESRQGKTVVALLPTPGLQPATVLTGSGAIRYLYTDSFGRLWAMCGNHLVEIFADNHIVDRGALTGGGLAGMVDNGLQLFVLDGAVGYTYTYSTGVLAQVVDVDFLGGTHIGYLDGYFLLLPLDLNQRFYWSDLNASTFDPLNFASAEAHPDILRALLVAHRELWLFGNATTEVWYSTGQTGAGGPEFARLGGGLIDYGCMAPFSPALVGESICWLAQNAQGDRMVMQALGLTATRISTHPIEAFLEQHAEFETVRGFGIQQGGHVYYWLTFPAAKLTWVYDLMTGLWHRRAWREPVFGTLESHLATTHTVAFGRHYIGTLQNDTLYTLEATSATDAGEAIVREVILPPVFNPDKPVRLQHRELALDIETGVGLDAGVVPGTDPHVSISYSDDGGHTWRGTRHVSVGPLGHYGQRVRITRLGVSRDRRYRLHFSDPCRFTVLGAMVDIVPLES